jgi:carboxyl-terminal processing protease
MKNLYLSFVLACSMLLAACGGGGSSGAAISSAGPGASVAQSAQASASGYPGDPTSCSIADQRGWLNAYMADQYFWNANLAVPDTAATSLDAYFNSLLFVPTDRYSFTQDATQVAQQVTQGTRTGYGYSLAFTDASRTQLQIRLVEPNGPAAVAGLQRGDTVLSIDDKSVASIARGELPAVTTSGVTRTFSLANAVGPPRLVTVVSRNFALVPVLSDKILTSVNGVKVGYLAYQEFTDLSLPALGAAFDRFRNGDVKELIVDLRYNGGGSVLVARALASLIGGSALDGKTFAKLRFNAQNSGKNFDFPFVADRVRLPAAPLEGLAQVIFITSPNTASASELVINSLKPFKNVVTIGAPTFGKPFGFQPRSACGVAYSAVNFETFNAADVGRYTTGLEATCTISDDLSKALGDPGERRTAAALGFVQTKSCPAVALATQENKAADQQNRARAATDIIAKPAWLEPAFGEVTPPAMVAD